MRIYMKAREMVNIVIGVPNAYLRRSDFGLFPDQLAVHSIEEAETKCFMVTYFYAPYTLMLYEYA